jgi:hypothetical protein
MNDSEGATTADETTQATQGAAMQGVAMEAPAAPRHINSVDATTGQPIVARVLARKAELEALLDGLGEDELREQSDLHLALATINDLLTGDLENVPAVVVNDMNTWLERNKHLAERAGRRSDQLAGGDSSPELVSGEMAAVERTPLEL